MTDTREQAQAVAPPSPTELIVSVAARALADMDTNKDGLYISVDINLCVDSTL